MSSPHPTPNPAESTHPYADILDQLITLGTDLAKQVHAQAGKDLPLDAAIIAFDRIARAVRRTVNLARHLAKPPAPEKAAPKTASARKRIIREVEDTINRRAPAKDAESLHAELRERLDHPELEDEIEGRPTEDIIADILRDLGLANLPGLPNTWTRRTPADIQALNIRATTRPPPRGQPQPHPQPRGLAPLPRTALREN